VRSFPTSEKKTMSRARGGKRNAGRQDAQPSKAGTKPEDKKKQQQQQQQGKQNVSSGSSALNDSNDDALPRLDIEKENGQFKEIAERINAAYTEITQTKERLHALTEHRKELQAREDEVLGRLAVNVEARKRGIAERDALRKAHEELSGIRRSKLEELNRQKKELPFHAKEIKDSKKLVALNLEQLENEERALERKIKSAATAGQDRAFAKELQSITAKTRLVREWAKKAGNAEAPVDPALDARIKELDQELNKIFEERRQISQELDAVKAAHQAKREEVQAAYLAKNNVSLKIEMLKKDREQLYQTISEKRKEHQAKVTKIMKATREKQAQIDQERLIQTKKHHHEKVLEELSDPFKDEIASCDRLTALLNRQSKQKRSPANAKDSKNADENSKNVDEEIKNADEESKNVAEEEGEEENHKAEEDDAENQNEEEDEKEEEEGEDNGERKPNPDVGKENALQFPAPTHLTFELVSIQPPATIAEIPATLDSIARKKVFRFSLCGTGRTSLTCLAVFF